MAEHVWIVAVAAVVAAPALGWIRAIRGERRSHLTRGRPGGAAVRRPRDAASSHVHDGWFRRPGDRP